MRKILTVTVTATILFGALTACAPSTDIGAAKPTAGSSAAPADKPAVEAPAEATTKAQPLSVSETAFGQNSYDPTSWWYVVIIDNPNTTYAYPSASLTVEATNAAGTIVDSAPSYKDLLPGKTAISGTFISVGAETITALNLRGPDEAQAVEAKDGLGAFTSSEVAAVSDEYSTTLAGNLTSTFVAEQSLVEVVGVARNAAGQIIASEMTYIDRLPVGGTVRFEIRFMNPLPADTTYEVYPSL